jgi:TrmH family RNA methyltransferase
MKKVCALSSKKGRDDAGLFLVEGEKLLGEIPDDWSVSYYAASEAFSRCQDLSAYEKKAPVYILEDSRFNKISDTLSPQGIIAACAKRASQPDGFFTRGCLVMLGEKLSDPGNIGTLIRTAEAAGCDGFILSEGSADIYNSKIVRSTAGSIFHVPFMTDVNAAEMALLMKKAGVRLAAASPRGLDYPYSKDFSGSLCIMVGNEAHGLSKELLGLADDLVKLPMKGSIDSLNAAMAGGILLYEAVRQRLK